MGLALIRSVFSSGEIEHLEYSARALPGGLRWEEDLESATLSS
jgi:hypothetical protein